MDNVAVGGFVASVVMVAVAHVRKGEFPPPVKPFVGLTVAFGIAGFLAGANKDLSRVMSLAITLMVAVADLPTIAGKQLPVSGAAVPANTGTAIGTNTVYLSGNGSANPQSPFYNPSKAPGFISGHGVVGG